ncbi:MAG: hypothetical protein Q8O94_01880 [bacterium]|nr:hypothetical protein [bacterium]
MLVEKIARIWSVNNHMPQQVDLIGLVTFGATKDGLTQGSQVTTRKALLLAKQHPEAKVAFGVFTLSHHQIEERVKRKSFERPFFAGKVVSTIEEAEKIHNSLPFGFTPRNIVIVTDQWHSRSAKLVWERIWQNAIPKPSIYVCSVPSVKTVNADNPTRALRSQWFWALVNVLRHLFLLFVPGSVWLMKKLNIHQPV